MSPLGTIRVNRHQIFTSNRRRNIFIQELPLPIVPMIKAHHIFTTNCRRNIWVKSVLRILFQKGKSTYMLQVI
eukprot:UN00542